MKKLLLLLLFPAISFCQIAQFDKVKSEGKFAEYINRDGKSIKVNDTIQIGFPSGGNHFIYITQGNMFGAAFLSRTKVVVNKIKSIGNSQRGYKVYLLFKGYGLLPVFIDYESAYDTGEIMK